MPLLLLPLPLVPRKMWHSGQTNNNGVSRGTQRRGKAKIRLGTVPNHVLEEQRLEQDALLLQFLIVRPTPS